MMGFVSLLFCTSLTLVVSSSTHRQDGTITLADIEQAEAKLDHAWSSVPSPMSEVGAAIDGLEKVQQHMNKDRVLSIQAKEIKPMVQDQDLERVRVQCQLTTGPVAIEVHPEWAPLGAARFLDMVSSGYMNGAALFRAVPNFLCQFGIAKDATLRKEFDAKGALKDDPLRPDVPIGLGTMAFAGSGPNSRTTQVWFAFSEKDKGLGTRPWETPFAQVVGQESLDAVRRINTEYGDTVDQNKIWGGYEYLEEKFPRLSYIQTCIVEGAPPAPPAPPPPAPPPQIRGSIAAGSGRGPS